MFECGWGQVFANGTPKIFELVGELEKRLKRDFPAVLTKIVDSELTVLNCFGHHFITLMVTAMPLTSAVRILDVFLEEGEKVLFDILLRLIKIHEAEILKLTDPLDIFSSVSYTHLTLPTIYSV
eukprot:TRINITY_DN20008_c0_g1_i2.p1 TRINITY_DN20008_c0_g1~~TRINITY_DN20008_c0_g1_i2.p1  ORF type:complete len:124 (+),score=13.43 TRINITY_DN20008_c0_g1_i2:307-678(+)